VRSYAHDQQTAARLAGTLFESGDGTRPAQAEWDCRRTKPHPSEAEVKGTGCSDKQSAKAQEFLTTFALSSPSSNTLNSPRSCGGQLADNKVVFKGFGFPEFGEHVYKQHEDFFQRIVNLQNALNALITRAYKDVGTCERLILNFAMLVGVSLMEVVTLVGNGFGQGAMKIVRGLIENSINAEYLRQNPDRCKDYLDWHWIEQHKLLNWAKQYNPPLFASISDDAKKLIEHSFQQIRPRFEYTTTRDNKRKMRDTWCELNLAERAFQTGFEETYRLVMPHANQILHGSIGGLGKHFDLEKDEHRIAIPPADDWGGEALIAAHESTLKALETLSKTVNVEPEPCLQSLIEDFHFVWSKPDTSTIQRKNSL
jgi:hypothetical protein